MFGFSNWRVAGALVAVAALVFSAGGSAKGPFRPGDIKLCNAKRCLRITNRAALDALSAFYYDGPEPNTASSAPRLGVPSFELRFSNGYATGIVVSAKFDRFLSYGVNEDRFVGTVWYQFPQSAALAIQKMRGSLKPMRLTRSALSRSK